MMSSEHHDCYHCGLPVVDEPPLSLSLEGEVRYFCCAGCQAVASVIHDGGLAQFYQYRTQVNNRPKASLSWQMYDREDIQQQFVVSEQNHYNVYLLLEGITCAACVWLIEQHIARLPGVTQVKVNASTFHCVIQASTDTPVSQLMAALAEIGYTPQPLTEDRQRQQRLRHQRTFLMRLGVAAFGMMQVGMVAIALYAGALQGIDEQWQHFLRWVSLLVATPVVLFSAQPFWSAAWRNLRRCHLTMDVPVALAIVLAYAASIWATWQQTGEVYFDSVSMFTFFLLLGRYLELRTRYRHWQANHTASLLPMLAKKGVSQQVGAFEEVALAQLVVGDKVFVAAGETIPCDGVVVEGQSAVVEALLTGESIPVDKQAGDTVIAGAVNTDGVLWLEVTAVHEATRLSTIERLTRFAQQHKPAIQTAADLVARYFVAFVLITALLVFFIWYDYRREDALWISLSVLVVTCPCALSLATPLALTATMSALRKQGLLVLKGHVIETLSQVGVAIFDKTGTLTQGRPEVADVCLLDGLTKEEVLSIAAALESGSAHPIATAFRHWSWAGAVREQRFATAQGVSAMLCIEEVWQCYRLGKPEFAYPDQPLLRPGNGVWILLASKVKPLAWIRLSDTLRADAPAALAGLSSLGIAPFLLSGDHPQAVQEMAQQLDGMPYEGGVTPEEKLAVVREKQQDKTVLMVGDGINDVPVLAGADVSIAMAGASDLARTHADAILLNNHLDVLPKAVEMARRCKKVMRQNMVWAITYNVLALPLAALGHVPPYMAAIGMSLSSLIVVFNAMRLSRETK